MTNGKCPTWLVSRWLEKHPTHTASAPETANLPQVTAFITDCGRGTPVIVGTHIVRSDWTICNERGKPIRFRKKPETILKAKLHLGEQLVVQDANNHFKRQMLGNLATGPALTVLIRKG